MGTGAAVAAARPFGRVDRYEPTLPADPRPLLASARCRSSTSVRSTARPRPPAPPRRTRSTLSSPQVLAARPANSLVLVAGVSDTDSVRRLHVAIADGPGYDGGWLTSSSTGRAGYLQLVDLAPTALAALGLPEPIEAVRRRAGAARRYAGPPIRPRPSPSLADADQEAAVQHRRVRAGSLARSSA